jgi:lysozyme
MAITHGIDVSRFQGSIDWAAVGRTGFRFALARMSIGRTTRDDRGRRNLRGMLGHVAVGGAYGVVGTAEPVEDGARLLADEVAAVTDPAAVLVMLDAEDFADGSHPTIAQVDRYAIELHRLLGRWPVTYVPGWWLDNHGYTARGRALANCPWAASHYLPQPWTEARLQANKPTNLHGFKRLAWLQYTDRARVSGISGNVDADVFYGDLGALRRALLGTPTEEDDLTKDEFKQAWRELTAQGIIFGQDSWADAFRVYKDQMDRILVEQRQTNGKLDRLIALLEAQAQAQAQPPVP